MTLMNNKAEFGYFKIYNKKASIWTSSDDNKYDPRYQVMGKTLDEQSSARNGIR